MARTANFHFMWEGVAVGSGSGGGTGAGSCCGVLAVVASVTTLMSPEVAMTGT